MTYQKPQAEVIRFEYGSFIATSGDTPIGNFTCGLYTIGGSCNSISWNASGYTCSVYSNGNCGGVSSPPGSTGDGCHAWKLTCSKF